jgi:hypothetical protein
MAIDPSRPAFPGREPTERLLASPLTDGECLPSDVVGRHGPDFADLVDEWGRQSFPASVRPRTGDLAVGDPSRGADHEG